MKKFSNILGMILFVFVLFLFLIIVFLPMDLNGCFSIEIEKGRGLLEISDILKSNGVVRSKYGFAFFSFLAGQARDLKAGVYEFCGIVNGIDVLNDLTSGKIAKVKVVLGEGWTIKNIAGILEAKEICLADNFEKVAAGLEGYLFPDTYYFEKQTPASRVAAVLKDNFEKKISEDLLAEISAQDKTLEDIVIMASMLEKEVRTYVDKQMVAGILWKRLKNNWKLQVDATLAYILGKTSLQLTLSDLSYDSPYNTYRYAGLPIGSICNPGLESIRAAILYEESDYWFYLSAKDDGRTIFSKTLAEHEANRKNYLR